MFSRRNRLLLLLVLVSVVTAAAWSPASAHGVRSGSPSEPQWTQVGKQPLVGPTSGEPDVGQGPKRGSRCVPVTQPPSETPGTGQPWFRWILRVWMSSYFGAR
jgi:hypothetical protein